MTTSSRRVEGIRDVALSDLREHPDNPRSIAPDRLEQLKAMLAADPEMLRARPLIALPDGTVIAGNQRLRAARELGWETIPVVHADIDANTARLWMLRDNNPMGEWTQDVGEMLADLVGGGIDVALAGFDPRTLDDLLAAVATPPPVDPDDVPPLPKKPRSKRGEVYELGAHRLMCGDSARLDDVTTLMGDVAAKLVLADPPYNVNYRGGTNTPQPGVVKREREDAYEDVFDDYEGWLAGVLGNGHSASDAKAPLLLWHSTSELTAVLRALERSGWLKRSYIVWDKGSIQGGIGQTAKQYRTQFEPLVYAHKRGRTPRWHGPPNESDVWAVAGSRNNPLHPTMKPAVLYERSIRNHSQLGDAVLELFGGSGTALIAAEMTGRRARLMEIDPAYCDVIRDRYEAFRG